MSFPTKNIKLEKSNFVLNADNNMTWVCTLMSEFKYVKNT